MNPLKHFWCNHVQTTIASILGSFALVDLTGYQDSITELIGHKGYAGIRAIGALGIIWRATQARNAQRADPKPEVCTNCGQPP